MKKLTIISVVAIFVIYLLAWFIQLEANPIKWPDFHRLLFAIAIMSTPFVIHQFLRK